MSFIARVVYVWAVLTWSLLASFQASALTCITKLPPQNGLLISFLNPSNEQKIPAVYQDDANMDTDCIVFMDLNWNVNVTIQFSTITFIRSYFRPTVQIFRIDDDFPATKSAKNLTIRRPEEIKFDGSTTKSFAIVYSKTTAVSAPFLLKFTTRRVRKLECPDLKSQFDSVLCNNGNEVGSNCTFQCQSGSYPAPDLFNPNTQSDTLRTFQSSSNKRFFTTCSLSERQRPAWKPDVITPQPSLFGTEWEDEPIQWKCVPLNIVKDVCLAGTGLPKLIQVIHFGRSAFRLLVSEYASIYDCYYPPEYLLSIFGEEKNQELVTTTTPPPPTLATSTIEAGGFVPPGRATQSPFEEAVIDPSLNTLDCSTYCKFDSSVGGFSPPCGNYETAVTQIDCLTCRYTGAASACGQLDVVS